MELGLSRWRVIDCVAPTDISGCIFKTICYRVNMSEYMSLVLVGFCSTTRVQEGHIY